MLVLCREELSNPQTRHGRSLELTPALVSVRAAAEAGAGTPSSLPSSVSKSGARTKADGSGFI